MSMGRGITFAITGSTEIGLNSGCYLVLHTPNLSEFQWLLIYNIGIDSGDWERFTEFWIERKTRRESGRSLSGDRKRHTET